MSVEELAWRLKRLPPGESCVVVAEGALASMDSRAVTALLKVPGLVAIGVKLEIETKRIVCPSAVCLQALHYFIAGVLPERVPLLHSPPVLF